MEYQEFSVDKDYKSVYYFLKDLGVSERYITFLRKEKGRIVINGQNAIMTSPLKSGDKLKIQHFAKTKSAIMQCILPLNIVYEDDYYLVVDKPSGLASIATKSHFAENLSGAVMAYLSPKISNYTSRVIGRLDKDTAGLVIFAKNLIAYNLLKSVQKTYYALCEGHVDKEFLIDKPIKTVTINGVNDRKRIISPDGKCAKTFVFPVKIYDGYSLIKVKIENGRTHQIRVHLSSVGHPLLGDEIYGKARNDLNHAALICKEVSFYHPFEKRVINLSADMPADFKKFLE